MKEQFRIRPLLLFTIINGVNYKFSDASEFWISRSFKKVVQTLHSFILAFDCMVGFFFSIFIHVSVCITEFFYVSFSVGGSLYSFSNIIIVFKYFQILCKYILQCKDILHYLLRTKIII